MSSLRDISKQSYGISAVGPTHQEIQIGALQRIADATELMAKNHAQLVADAERAKRRHELSEQALSAEQRTSRALRGQVTKLRNQLAARTAPAPTPDALDGARLDALSRPGWELSMSDDPEVESWQLWQVHRCSGGRNDREWTLIGAGATPREALDAAMKKEPKP